MQNIYIYRFVIIVTQILSDGNVLTNSISLKSSKEMFANIIGSNRFVKLFVPDMKTFPVQLHNYTRVDNPVVA